VPAGRAGDERLVLVDRLEAQHLAREHEGVARGERFEEHLLHLAEHPPAPRQHRPGFPARGAGQAHLEAGRFDDGADVHPVRLSDPPVAHPPKAVGASLDLGEALVGAKRVAAGRDEIDHGLEPLVGEPGIGGGGADLLVKVLDGEGFGAGHAEHVLAKHVERALPGVRRVLGRLVHRVEGGGAFEDLEAVRGDEVGLGGLVHAVIRAADALHDPARPFRRADVHHEVHVAPVDAEVEGRGADHGLELAFDHGGFHAPALAPTSREP
jgi:hypothetical protein